MRNRIWIGVLLAASVITAQIARGDNSDEPLTITKILAKSGKVRLFDEDWSHKKGDDVEGSSLLGAVVYHNHSEAMYEVEIDNKRFLVSSLDVKAGNSDRKKCQRTHASQPKDKTTPTVAGHDGDTREGCTQD